MQLSPIDPALRQDAERLADIFTKLQRRLILKLSKELSRGKLSFAQYFLLGFLARDERLSMSEIATKMGHTTAAATGLVDRLEALGFLKRSHCCDDRRKIEVEITASGAELVSRVREDMIGNVLCMMSKLTTEQQKTWVYIYEKVLDHCTEECTES